ncbi:hypothetical protein QWY31_03610 [Cytophagales bacterium LB-30]|uniref:Uncharacterized protein n=1 Tax=Shiella aurantiaca TaxID=3058365 RepID=A0ABT8F291_9BACT|nr:hypothetical protein [Shiella aurantiaca]MDN4164572.1 hypothetical protein [Shiella aurantiaca]
MQRYFDNSLFIDIAIAFSIGLVLYFSRPMLQDFVQLPKIETLNGFNVSMISVSATLLGFLLTIITIIVTFKNSFAEKLNDKQKEEIEDFTTIPTVTIFDKKKSNARIFYNTPIHKAVVSVFISATYEVSLVLFFLLLIQFNIIYFTALLLSIANFSVFLLLVFTLARSLYIFHLFLNVHVYNE